MSGTDSTTPSRRRGRATSLLLGALVVLSVAAPASAHDRGTSYSTIDLRGRDARIVLRITELDVSRFPWAVRGDSELHGRLGGYLTDHLQLVAGETPCPVADGPRQLATPPGTISYEWALACPPEGGLRLHSTLLREVSPSHLHFARLRMDGGAGVERVLSERGEWWDIAGGAAAAEPSAGTDLGGYVLLGIEHILGGYDHLAFVLALLLLGGSLGEVAKMVTGFTVAHSLTLALMVLGYFRPDPAPIEALIGLSIALVALENGWQLSRRSAGVPAILTASLVLVALPAAAGHGRVPAVTLLGLSLFVGCYFGLLRSASNPSTLRWAIAFVFGLVHGFGFAAVLAEVGLPRDRVLPALFGFNAGVEIGQLAVVVCLWPILRALAARRPAAFSLVVEAGSGAILALGLFWFLTRTYGW